MNPETSVTIVSNDREMDTIGALNRHQKNDNKWMSLSAYIVAILQSEPDRPFVIKDLVDRTEGKPDTIKRILSRLSSSGKGAGPVRRLARGLYKYEERDDLQALVKSGNWKIENLVFVSTGAHPPLKSPPETSPISHSGDTINPCIPVPLFGPWTLDTGQVITCEGYKNGTKMLRLSAHGASPFSTEQVLTILFFLRQKGFDISDWECTSIELNIDSRRHRIDASYTYQVIRGLFIKVYQHGNFGRVELADRRSVPTHEVMKLFQALSNKLDGTEALREVSKLNKRVSKCEKDNQLALSIGRKNRDKIEEMKARKDTPTKEQRRVSSGI